MSLELHKDIATELLDLCRIRGIRIVTAESCTGGLVAGTLTAVPGSSDVFDGGYISYSYDAKTTMLAVPRALIYAEGAVSEAVARAMVDGLQINYRHHLCISVTGVAGPGSDSQSKEAGLVHFAAGLEKSVVCRVRRYGDIGRSNVRSASVRDALELAKQLTVSADSRVQSEPVT